METEESPSEIKTSSSSEDVPNMMDFGELVTPTGRAAGLMFGRPQLTSQRQTVYEDRERVTQVLIEMHRFYQDGQLCDITLEAEESRYPCHRLVLAASSLYFERMFSNGMSEASADEITLNNVTSTALHRLIDFAYTSRLTLSCDYALETFEAADMLQFERVRGFCADFLCEQIDEKNCLSFVLYADAFACITLYDRAMLCAAKHFQTVSNQSEFLSLPLSHLSTLLREDNLEVEYEEYVHEAMKRWVMHDLNTRSAYLASLFAHVRLNFVSRWYLIEVISKDEMLLDSLECRRLVQSAKDQLLAQGHTYEIPWQLPPSRKCTGLTQKIVYVNTHDPYPAQSEVFLFDVVNKSWSSTGRPCPLASDLSICVSVRGEASPGGGGDSLLVIGGWTNATGNKSLNQRGAVNIIHEFKVMSIFPTLWYVRAHQMSLSRYLHSSLCVHSSLFLLGGYDETHSLQATMFVADTAAVTASTSMAPGYRFEACAALPIPLARVALARWGNFIYAFGGFGLGGIPSHRVWCYNVVANRWSEVTPGLPQVGILCGECGREFGLNSPGKNHEEGQGIQNIQEKKLHIESTKPDTNHRSGACESSGVENTGNKFDSDSSVKLNNVEVMACGEGAESSVKASLLNDEASTEKHCNIARRDTVDEACSLKSGCSKSQTNTEATVSKNPGSSVCQAAETGSSNAIVCNTNRSNTMDQSERNVALNGSHVSTNTHTSHTAVQNVSATSLGTTDRDASAKNILETNLSTSEQAILSNNSGTSEVQSQDCVMPASNISNSVSNASCTNTSVNNSKTCDIKGKDSQISKCNKHSDQGKTVISNDAAESVSLIDQRMTKISITDKKSRRFSKSKGSVCPQCKKPRIGADPPTCRMGGVNSAQYASFINGQFYVICGTVGGVEPSCSATAAAAEEMGGANIGQRLAERIADCVFTFDPVSRRWNLVHRFSEVRTGSFSVATLRDRIYLAGGLKAGHPCRTIECFDPQSCTVEVVGSTKECGGSLSLCTTLCVMHENFGM